MYAFYHIFPSILRRQNLSGYPVLLVFVIGLLMFIVPVHTHYLAIHNHLYYFSSHRRWLRFTSLTFMDGQSPKRKSPLYQVPQYHCTNDFNPHSISFIVLLEARRVTIPSCNPCSIYKFSISSHELDHIPTPSLHSCPRTPVTNIHGLHHEVRYYTLNLIFLNNICQFIH